MSLVVEWGVLLAVTLAFLFDFTNGFHDAANTTATVIASKALPPLTAVCLSALFNFLPAFLGRTLVANTVSSVVDIDAVPAIGGTLPVGIGITLSALVAAIFWNAFTWKYGIPSSSSHALVGGLVGAGLGAGGSSVINWASLGTIGIAIVVSPLLAFAVSLVLMLLVRACLAAFKLQEDSTVFRVLQIASSCWLSWGHGSNDAQKTMGVITLMLYAAGYVEAPNSRSLSPPLWVIFTANFCIATGTLYAGWAIIHTVGFKITRITQGSGFAAAFGAACAIEGSSGLGIPISTTQATTSAVIGSGVGADREVRWATLQHMLIAWLVTLPSSFVVGSLVVQLVRIPAPANLICILAVAVLLLGWGIWIGWHSMTKESVAAELATLDESGAVEQQLELTATSASQGPLDGMCRPVDTKMWKSWLYFVNSVMIIMALTFLGVSLWGFFAPQAAVFRTQYSHLLYWGVGVSVTLICLSGCGCIGGAQAESNERKHTKHWCLSTYFVILSLLFCLQVGAMAASIVLHIQIQEALSVPYNPVAPSALDEEITHNLLLTHPQVWKDIQDDFNCCGWGVTDDTVPAAMVVNEGIMTINDLTTGAACTQITENPCRGYVMTWVMDDLSWVIVISVVVIAVEMMAMVSTICICCCARASDWDGKLSIQHSDLEKYSKLRAGEDGF